MTHRTVALSFIVLCLILCPGCATTAPNADTTTKQGQTKANEVVEPVEKQAAAEAQGVEKQPDAAEQHSTGTTLGQPKQLSAHERHPLDIKGVSGLSGLTTDGQGHLWAVSERDLTLLQIHEQKVVKQVKIDMKGEAMDFESITWLSDNRFALGTERDSERREDNVIILELNDSGAVEKSRRRVSYDEAGGPAAKNRGLEAICALDTSTVLVGSEKVVERSGADGSDLATRSRDRQAGPDLAHPRVG